MHSSILDELSKPFDGSDARSPLAAKRRAKKLGYIRQDGVLSLSYSRLQTLHSCPRKFLLREVYQRAPEAPSIHLAFGSAFGAGLAELFRSNNIERALVVALSHWDYDAFDSDYVKNKSFWECCRSLRIFHANFLPEISEEWELAYIDGKPAVELLFYIRVSESYDYQGHIDIILRNKITGALRVVECKTASKEQVEANWANSEQALGYYFVLRALSAATGANVAPETYYITLQVGKWHSPEDAWGFKFFPFHQSEYSEAEFSGGLFSAMHILDFYIEHNFFPKRGSGCIAYGRTCEHFGTCDFDAARTPTDGESTAVYDALDVTDADLYLDMTGNHPMPTKESNDADANA
jgi:hypothetical protein